MNSSEKESNKGKMRRAIKSSVGISWCGSQPCQPGLSWLNVVKGILNAGVGQVQKNQIKTSPSQREVKNYISCFCSLFKCSCINGILIFVIFVAIMKEDQGEANAIMCILWLDLDSDWLALLGMLLSTKPRSCNHKSQACTSTRLPNLAIKSLESHAAMPSSQRSNTQKKDYATCLLSLSA